MKPTQLSAGALALAELTKAANAKLVSALLRSAPERLSRISPRTVSSLTSWKKLTPNITTFDNGVAKQVGAGPFGDFRFMDFLGGLRRNFPRQTGNSLMVPHDLVGNFRSDLKKMFSRPDRLQARSPGKYTEMRDAVKSLGAGRQAHWREGVQRQKALRPAIRELNTIIGSPVQRPLPLP